MKVFQKQDWKERVKRFLRRKWVLESIFLMGLLIMLFPFVSQYLHYQASRTQVVEFKSQVQDLKQEEIQRRIELAHAYNSTLEPGFNHLKDPYTTLQKEGIREYARMLEVREMIGTLKIPKISVELPVYAGTSESVLQTAVGHLEVTSLPVGGQNSHSVLTAHRGLPTARLFTDLNQLRKGDVFYFQNIQETLAYQVDQIKTVEPTDLKSIAIEPGEDRMTLLTCTPYMINSHRLLVYGKRIPYQEALEEKSEEIVPAFFYQWVWWLLAVLILLLLFLGLYIHRKKRSHRYQQAYHSRREKYQAKRRFDKRLRK